jgi:hypothetical protein
MTDAPAPLTHGDFADLAVGFEGRKSEFRGRIASGVSERRRRSRCVERGSRQGDPPI